MTKLHKFAIPLLAVSLASGCANQEIKPATILCPLLGSVLGAGIVAGGLGGDDAGPMAAGAALGAAAGYFLCVDRAAKPTPAPAPAPKAAAPAPRPAPAPAPKDSDGDGVIDPNDKCPGTSAGVRVNADGCPEVGTTLISLEGVNFALNSATILPESEGKLDEAVRVLNENPSVSVSVEGHTDSRGSDGYNQTLSDKRAASVVAYLVGKGIDASRMTSIGHGEAKPMAPNDSEENMYKNRRVELVVTKS